MKNYLKIGHTINLLSMKAEYRALSLILFIICGLIFLSSIPVGIDALTEYFWSDKIKKSISFFKIIIVSGLFLLSGIYIRKIDRNFYNKSVIEYMKREELENVDPVKLLENIKKVQNFNGVVSENKNSYYNYLLNEYYNGNNSKEELFKNLEK